MMKPKFRADKATQIAALLIQRSDGTINHMKLVKLMYLIERENLDRHGSPIIFDRFCSLPKGPIVSNTLSLINSDASEEDEIIWSTHISERINHSVSLNSNPDFDVLSPAEMETVEAIFEQYGSWHQFNLVDLTHTFEEWKDPGDSMIPIGYDDVLKALKKSPEEIDAILEELNATAFADQVFG